MPVRPPLKERRLARFPKSIRPVIIGLAAKSPRLADLAVSFPAALAALAAPPRGMDVAAVERAVLDGRSLKEVAALARLPLWTRALPPEAFVGPVGALPDDDWFRRRIANSAPRSPGAAGPWLKTVAEAYALSDAHVAAWVAREISKTGKPPSVGSLRQLCVWAWFSQRPEGLGRQLVADPWSMQMRLPEARKAADRWLENLKVALRMGLGEIDDVWLCPETVEGFEIVPVRTAFQLIEEARAMRNCARHYAYCLASARSRIWSVRKDGERRALVEIGGQRGDPFLRPLQVSMKDNEPVGEDTARAIHLWLRSHPLSRTPPANKPPIPGFDKSVWKQAFRPYWIAKRRIPFWLPLDPTDAPIFRAS